MSGESAKTSLALVAIGLAFASLACAGGQGPSPTAAVTSSASAVRTNGRPTEPPCDGYAIRDDFFDLVFAPEDLSFHVSQQGRLESSGRPAVTILLELDVAGRDMSGHITAITGGQSLDFDLVVIGQEAWVRIDGPWALTTREAVAADETLDPWRYLGNPIDFRFVSGRCSTGGQLHFRSSARLPYRTASMTADTTASITQADLYLRPDGVPLRVDFLIEAERSVASQVVQLTGSTTVRFSNWGVTLEILEPSVAP